MIKLLKDLLRKLELNHLELIKLTSLRMTILLCISDNHKVIMIIINQHMLPSNQTPLLFQENHKLKQLRIYFQISFNNLVQNNTKFLKIQQQILNKDNLMMPLNQQKPLLKTWIKFNDFRDQIYPQYLVFTYLYAIVNQ